MWSSRFLQDSSNQCEEEHKRCRLCSCTVQNRDCSSAVLQSLGFWVSMQVYTQRSWRGVLQPLGMAYTHLNVQVYDVSHPTDNKADMKNVSHLGVFRRDIEAASSSIQGISKIRVITCMQATWIQTGKMQRKGSSRMSGIWKPMVWVEASFFHLQSSKKKAQGNRTAFCTLGGRRRTGHRKNVFSWKMLLKAE